MDHTEPHILVVDDDERIRTLLARFLTGQSFRITTAEDAADAAAKMTAVAFDLLVVDVMMPGQDGFEFVAALRQRQNHVPVILLTARGEAEDRIRGFETGADDYLPKPFEPRELVLRINAILKRAALPAPAPVAQTIRFGDFVFDLVRGELKRDGTPIALTTGEAQLLRILGRSPGITVPRAALSEPGVAVESRAVDVQITRLRRKIEADPRNPRYLQTVWGEGYVLWLE
ncbi:response regulator [Ferrovibrio xuzhouensis]|uniref:Response regulator n=1 Tax=Ferrovibrio xuzhouensis TaxID=1576914 RepID=A0ABV7VK59_9PROT